MIKKLFGYFWTEFNKKVWWEKVNLVILRNLKTITGFIVARLKNTNIPRRKDKLWNDYHFNIIYNTTIILWNINSTIKTKIQFINKKTLWHILYLPSECQNTQISKNIFYSIKINL